MSRKNGAIFLEGSHYGLHNLSFERKLPSRRSRGNPTPALLGPQGESRPLDGPADVNSTRLVVDRTNFLRVLERKERLGKQNGID